MFAIAFDLVVAEVGRSYSRHFSLAYKDIESKLRSSAFYRIRGGIHTCNREDLANLSSVMNALRALPWFPTCVRDIRAFLVGQWSDFTAFMKGPAP